MLIPSPFPQLFLFNQLLWSQTEIMKPMKPMKPTNLIDPIDEDNLMSFIDAPSNSIPNKTSLNIHSRQSIHKSAQLPGQNINSGLVLPDNMTTAKSLKLKKPRIPRPKMTAELLFDKENGLESLDILLKSRQFYSGTAVIFSLFIV